MSSIKGFDNHEFNLHKRLKEEHAKKRMTDYGTDKKSSSSSGKKGTEPVKNQFDSMDKAMEELLKYVNTNYNR